MTQRKKQKKRQKKRLAPIIEALEPRVLFSADMFGGAVDSPGTDDSLATLLDDTAVALQQQTTQLQQTESKLSEPLPEDDDENVISPLTEGSTRLELVFIDSATPDYQVLLDDLLVQSGANRQIDVVMLDADRDGIEQITETLQGYQDVNAIHIISHGDDGTVGLGSTQFSASNLSTYQQQLQSWNLYLDVDADILIYGCNLAESASGQSLIDQISTLTGADIAASDDLTGHSNLGGDWKLG